MTEMLNVGRGGLDSSHPHIAMVKKLHSLLDSLFSNANITHYEQKEIEISKSNFMQPLEKLVVIFDITQFIKTN